MREIMQNLHKSESPKLLGGVKVACLCVILDMDLALCLASDKCS